MAMDETDPVSVAPVRGELRYGLELARLLADGRFNRVTPAADPRPVLLIPGFLAGDVSLTVLAGWLRRRGHEVRGSGMLVNVGCAGGELTRLEQVLAEFDAPPILIGQSRGGTLARALAARHPQAVAGLVTLGSPVLDPLAVSSSVLANRPVRLPASATSACLGCSRATAGTVPAAPISGRCWWPRSSRPCPRSRCIPAPTGSWIGGRASIPTRNASRSKGATAGWP